MTHRQMPTLCLLACLFAILTACLLPGPRPALAASPAGFKAAVGGPFPDLALRLTAEQAASLGLPQGKDAEAKLSSIPAEAVLLLVVGYFCPPCHAEMPRIKELCARIEARGLSRRLRLVAIAAGDDQNLVAQFQAKHPGLCLPIVPDPDLSQHKRLGSPAIPALYVLTRHKGGLRLAASSQGEFREAPDAFLDSVLARLRPPRP